MGSPCSKQVPDIKLKTDVKDNTCFDDLVCPSTCCIIVSHSKKAKLNLKLKHDRQRKAREMQLGELDKNKILDNNI